MKAVPDVEIPEWDDFAYRTRGPILQDFDYYRPHLASLLDQMREWKPRLKRELLIPGYRDRVTYYSAYFGIVIGILRLIGVISAIIAAVFTILLWARH
jgi:hypothetical protein